MHKVHGWCSWCLYIAFLYFMAASAIQCCAVLWVSYTLVILAPYYEKKIANLIDLNHQFSYHKQAVCWHSVSPPKPRTTRSKMLFHKSPSYLPCSSTYLVPYQVTPASVPIAR
ncbi:hypothetical protein BJX61DRAFT_28028 [Aspergillus egyptiacus]|nr:hypothetical protein BJX61DRAFT_28028 [Aspergillus egyptiacus]